MKHFFLVLLFVNVFTFSFGQTNPENIIIQYNSDGSQTIINKNDLSTDPDSVDVMLFYETQEMYRMKLDSLELLNRLVGKWTFSSAKRTNGKDSNASGAITYEFKKNGAFVSIDAGERLSGKWTVDTGGYAVITLKYDKPKVMIKDKKVLKTLDKETLKSITFSSETITLAAIDSTSLTITSSTIAGDRNDVSKMFYRIILLHYDKSGAD